MNDVVSLLKDEFDYLGEITSKEASDIFNLSVEDLNGYIIYSITNILEQSFDLKKRIGDFYVPILVDGTSNKCNNFKITALGMNLLTMCILKPPANYIFMIEKLSLIQDAKDCLFMFLD